MKRYADFSVKIDRRASHRSRRPGSLLKTLLGALLCCIPLAVQATDPEQLLHELDSFAHASLVDSSDERVIDYEIGLGAMQKRLGNWQFKRSERVDGQRMRYTWQITDGFTSQEVFARLSEDVAGLAGSEPLFACEGRSCGNGAEWANRVFSQRVLYGRADAQRYRVFRITRESQTYWFLLYAGARTSDRQYLHAELVIEAND